MKIAVNYLDTRHISFFNPWKFSRNLIISFHQFLAEMYKQENPWKIFTEWCCGSLFKKRTFCWHYLFWLKELFRNGKKLMESFFKEWSIKNNSYQSFFEKYFSQFIPWKTTVRKYPTGWKVSSRCTRSVTLWARVMTQAPIMWDIQEGAGQYQITGLPLEA